MTLRAVLRLSRATAEHHPPLAALNRGERIAYAAELMRAMRATYDADTALPDDAMLLAAAVAVPQHVVYRSFPTETVVLNLETGKYHGLNATAGRMLEELERAACVMDAVVVLAEAYGQPREVIERDVCLLCRSLHERGLIEVDRGSAG